MRNSIFFFLFITQTLLGINNSREAKSNFELLEGSIFFHRYSSYEALDSKLMMVDLPSFKLVEISREWKIIHPMNAHLSRNGKYLTFMGLRPSDKKWSIYLWNLDLKNQPINISSDNFGRNEDPKFSYDSEKIAFKCDGDLCLYTLATKELKKILSSATEISMPFWHPSNQGILFSSGAKSLAGIEYFDLKTKTVKVLYNEEKISEYYPVSLNKRRFFYVRWKTENNLFDQIHLGYFNGKPSKPLLFNTDDSNSSDPCKINKYLLFFSRHKNEAGIPRTGYDLYLANTRNTNVYKLPQTINSEQEELGCQFHKKRFPKIYATD